MPSTILWGAVLTAGFAILCAGAAAKEDDPAAKARDKALVAKYEVKITSSKDGSEQPALFYRPPAAKPDVPGEGFPLLVVLHSWSTTYAVNTVFLPIVEERGWVMVSPNFRGVNKTPQACASEFAIADVLDAVAYAKKNARVDINRIYLYGASGGGHMSLMMASSAPDVWAGVSAWVPISDLTRWHAETTQRKLHYTGMLELCCGGPPNPQTEAEYKARSPLYILAQAKNVPLDINSGIHDGHTGSVPVSQGLRAFNVLAEANGQKDRLIADADIDYMTANRTVPEALIKERETDPERSQIVQFRRVSNNARITVFEGGHQDDKPAGMAWLARQRKASPATFALPSGQKGERAPDLKGGNEVTP